MTALKLLVNKQRLIVYREYVSSRNRHIRLCFKWPACTVLYHVHLSCQYNATSCFMSKTLFTSPYIQIDFLMAVLFTSDVM